MHNKCSLRKTSKPGQTMVLLGFALLVSQLGGCSPYAIPIPAVATKKVAEVISLSDERNMVTMGAPYTFMEKPTVDWHQARSDAAAQCAQWKGLSQAEPVGPTRRECLTYAGTDCIRYAIVGDYHCSH